MKNTLEYVFEEKSVTDLRQLVVTSAERYAEKDLYLYSRNKEKFSYKYKDLLNNMNYLGTAFMKLGIMGGTVAVIGDSHPMYFTTYYATVNGNGIIIPLDKELADDEIVNFLNLANADAIVYNESFNNRIAKYADRLPNIKYFIPIYADTEKEVNDRTRSMDEVLALGKEALDAGETGYLDVEIDREKCCAIIFTSGTTGTSKGVMLSQKNLAFATNSSCVTMSFMTCHTSLLSVLPPNHTYEMTCGHLAATNKGMTSYLNESLKYVTKNLAAFKPTTLTLVPLFVETFHKRIWDNIKAKGMEKKVRLVIKLSKVLPLKTRKKIFGEILSALGGRLEYIVCGGAPIDKQIIKDFRAFGIRVLEGYGITECSPLVAVNIAGHERFGSVGWAVDGCKVKIDPEEGQMQGKYQIGEILVKGDNVMLGYYNNPEATAEVFTEDGWFRTGDYGYIDDQDYIFITGRKKNIIILSNGKNIYPEEIEGYLAHIDMIKECVVVGQENASGEVVITALVYPDPDKREGRSDEEILSAIKSEINEVNKKLPVFKQVRDVVLRDTEFEKTTSRKIKRHTLKNNSSGNK